MPDRNRMWQCLTTVKFGNDTWITLDEMDSAFPQPNVTREPQDSALDRPSHAPLGTDVLLPPQVPSDIPDMDPWQSGTQVPTKKEESPPVAENLPTVDNRSFEVGQTLLLRSSRVCKAPNRLIELIKTGTLNFTFVLFHFSMRTARK